MQAYFLLKDKKINKYNLSTGKLVGTFKEEGELGQPVKVSIMVYIECLVLPYWYLLELIFHRSLSTPLEDILFAPTWTSLWEYMILWLERQLLKQWGMLKW